jgi:hypothetical protein
MPQFEFIVPGMQKTTTQSYRIDRMEISTWLTIIVWVWAQRHLKGIGRMILRHGTEGTEVCSRANGSGFFLVASSNRNRLDLLGLRVSSSDSSTYSFQEISQVACSASELYNPGHRVSSLVLASSTARRGYLHE